MPEQPNGGVAQFRADVPERVEQEAVRTTIVGGRPPGSGQPIGQIPRGLEVLLKKAAVDPEFRQLLFDDPNQAAASIELTLEPVESTMLQTFPKEQLAAIIDRTEVPQRHRRTFLEKSAIAMLLLLTGGVAGTVGCPLAPKGSQPDVPITGSRSDDPCPPDDEPQEVEEEKNDETSDVEREPIPDTSERISPKPTNE